MKKWLTVFLIALVTLGLLAGCGQNASTPKEGTKRENEDPVKKVFAIEAKKTAWVFNDELAGTAWTYNGSWPGQEIRVQEGDYVVLRLKNSLPDPTALHLHGFPIPNAMDGVPGVTQELVNPGEEFTYEFVATTPGTYWYHSHHDSANQLEKGLYAAFIVEPKEQEDYDLDQVIIIDELSSINLGQSMSTGGMGHTMNNNEMDHNEAEEISHEEMMSEMYDTLSVNGKAAPAFEPIKVNKDDLIRLRFLNAGLFNQLVSIPGHSFKVTHYDGQPVNESELINQTSLIIAPGERYDVEIVMDNPGAWGIKIATEKNEDKLSGSIPLIYAGSENQSLKLVDAPYAIFDFTKYGQPREVSLGSITRDYEMVLDSKDNGETFGINGRKFPEPEVYPVKTGDLVKMTIRNDSGSPHPMHIHGHLFYVFSKNGQPVTGSPVLKETLNIYPDETYEIVFVADNPGTWVFHCHELHHAENGMVAVVQYE